MYKKDLRAKWAEELTRLEGELAVYREELAYAESDNVFGDGDEVVGTLVRDVRALELSIEVLGTLLEEIEGISDMDERDTFYMKWAKRRSELMGKEKRLEARIQEELDITRQTAGLTDWDEVDRSETAREEVFVELSMIYNVLKDVMDLVVG